MEALQQCVKAIQEGAAAAAAAGAAGSTDAAAAHADAARLRAAAAALAAARAGGEQAPLEAVLAASELLEQQLTAPPSAVFASLGGAPAEPLPELAAAGDAQRALAAARLQLQLQLLAALGRVTLQPPATEEDDQPPPPTPGRDPRAPPKPRPFVGIVEIVEENGDGDDEGEEGVGAGGSSGGGDERRAAARLQQQQQRCVRHALLAAALFGAAAGPGTVMRDDGSGEDDDILLEPLELPRPGECTLDAFCRATVARGLQLPSPWSSAACERCCEELLAHLAAHVAVAAPPASAAPSPSSSSRARTGIAPSPSPSDASRDDDNGGGGSGPAAQAQALLAAALPQLLDALRDTLMAQHRHRLASEAGELTAYQGPGTFERAAAARQLAWLAQRLSGPRLDARLGALLPLVLAACDDPSPAVQRCGHAAMGWLARGAGAAALRFQAALLVEEAARLAVGCEESCWATAMPAATSVVLAVEGRNPRGGALHRLLAELAVEAERAPHKPQQRLVFMACVGLLAPRAGLHALRHLAAVAPLLLEWAHAHDAASAAVALQLLARLAEGCWPRMPAHAAAMWPHLVAVARQADTRGGVAAAAAASNAAEAAGGGRASVVDAALQLARVLSKCGGEPFAAAVKETAAAAATAAGANRADDGGGGASAMARLLAAAEGG